MPATLQSCLTVSRVSLLENLAVTWGKPLSKALCWRQSHARALGLLQGYAMESSIAMSFCECISYRELTSVTG